MQLSTLLHGLNALPVNFDCDIKGLSQDSRCVKTGDLFIALQGTQVDGQKYMQDAIAHGASAILIDAETAVKTIQHHGVPIIAIQNLQFQLGEIAARFYDYPAKKLRMLGVTGTNGKTTCTHLIAQVLQSLAMPCGVIGTLGSGLYGSLIETGFTTPDAITLQNVLHSLVQQRAQTVAMEVSSHSINQGRINGITFEAGIFTNLTQDHLDYHGDMETYAAVKHRFIAEAMTRQVVINMDDERGRLWMNELVSRKPVFSYSTHKTRGESPRIPHSYAENITLSLEGVRAHVYTPWGHGELRLPLIGEFNLSNALAVLVTMCLYGLDFDDVLHALSVCQAIPGRMQSLHAKNGALIVVDFSHTPDSLEKALSSLKAHTEQKLICIFGCGGDRDREKRPIMAKIAEQFADQVIVTNDNPRHENPLSIIDEIKAGFNYLDKVSVIPDRSQAIMKGIQLAEATDCVLIAGKGAERYQEIGNVKYPFDDVVEVRNEISK
jgi:UDP-N-acetylmuramoyl-L-alanyl-D-glutamate--2,6-diaminopimelate ligase